MSFQPENITKANILDAVKKIEIESIELKPSTKFDVIINGKAYPPKEIMRYAHELMNGENVWDKSGGTPTNKYLEAFGFEIKGKVKDNSFLTGTIWKLGCNWGSGNPSFYDFIKQEAVVIGVNDKKYTVGDLIVITKGHKVHAIARVSETPQSVTSNTSYNPSFDELKIEYNDRVNYSEAEWYELKEDEVFSYELQKGICKVQNFEIKKRVAELWRDKNISYWIFQGNSDSFDFETALKENILETWTVSSHKDKIKTGDKNILWITGKKAGCYALAEVISDPNIIEKARDSHLWKKEDKNSLKAGIKITHNLWDKPLLWNEVKNHPDLKNLKVGNQGTNFLATRAEYKILKSIIMTITDVKEEFMDWFIKKGDHNYFSNQFNSSRDEFKNALAEYANYFPENNIFKVTNENSKEIYQFLKNKVYSDQNFLEFSKAKSEHMPRAIMGKNNYLKFLSEQFIYNTNSAFSINSPNIILYGPPGTGKTYRSIDYAVNIATGSSSDIHSENKIKFDELRKQGQIEFVTFHQNYCYEDFMIGVRPDLEFSELKFRNHKGIFYRVAKKARDNYLDSLKDAAALSYEAWVKDMMEDFKDHVQSIIEKDGKYTVKNAVSIYSVEEDAFVYTGIKSDGEKWKNERLGMHYEPLISMFINDAKDRKDIKNLDGIPSLEKQHATYCIEVLQKFREYLKSNKREFSKEKSTSPELKNFVLIIDEINRANISKVFGELITLLEDDKRLGQDNELKITLPNGEEDFGVPPNLYIIGTMNTADKSIALIDIALRRRFEFIGQYPKYEDLNEEESDLLKKINAAVFEKKKSADYLIGHAYFMKSLPIEIVLNGKVVPLLMEYFSGKTEIVSSVFENSAWSVKYDTTSFNWTISKN